MSEIQSYGELIIGQSLDKETVGGVPHYAVKSEGEVVLPAQFSAVPWIAAWYVNAMGNLCLVPFRFKDATGQKLEPVGWTLVCSQTSATMAVVEEGWKPGTQLTAVIKRALRKMVDRVG